MLKLDGFSYSVDGRRDRRKSLKFPFGANSVITYNGPEVKISLKNNVQQSQGHTKIHKTEE